MLLQVIQKTQDGRSKVWKLDSKNTLVTFGSSRKSNLVSIDKHSTAFDLAFEYRNDGWHVIQFGTQHDQADISIQNGSQIKFGESILNFNVIPKEAFVFDQLEKVRSEGQNQKVLLITAKNKKIVDVQVKEKNTKISTLINGQQQVLNFNQINSNERSKLELNGLEYRAKLVSVNETSDLAKMKPEDLMDEESKKMLVATLSAAFLFIFIGVVTPGKKTETAEIQLPKSTESAVVKFDTPKPVPKKKMPKESSENKVAQSAPAGSGSGGKVSALIKGAVGVRISQLIGKVSATEARTAEVLVSKSGIAADQGQTGRALAAVGKVESSGRNWNGEAAAVGGGKGVSTAGVGGGKSGNGLGNGLAAGKTGSGGVGLVEEESEVVGGLDREVIAQYIKTQLGQILYCYERQLSANPDLYGKVAVKFTISGNGQVESQMIGQSTLNSTPVEGCILNKISKWKFPEPRGGTKVVVTYPFLFKSTN